MARRPDREEEFAVRTGRGAVLCERCELADTPLRRLRGLLGRDLPAGCGLLIAPASSIHMFFMAYAIDAVFLDGDDRVLRIVHGLAPWRLAARRGACSVLEIAAGEAARRGIAVGDTLELVPRHSIRLG